MKKFATIEARAAKRKGGADALEGMLASPATKSALRRKADHRYLAQMAKNIFASGFRWRVVEAKWPDIEEAFGGFEVARVAAFDSGDLAELLEDKRVIRHRGKLEAIVDNARFIIDAAPFPKLVADWPDDDIIGLWEHLAKNGRLLGGNVGPRFLRGMGKDTFILSQDVVACLIDANVIEKPPTSKKAKRAVQAAFNAWREETGRPLCQLSRIASMSIGENYGVPT